MNIVAYPLDEAEQKLQAIDVKYQVIVARHRHYLGECSDSCYYVIRQQIDNDGVYHLIVAAKMGKGVF